MSAGSGDPLAVAMRFVEAANRHDLDALVACMASDFDSVQPMRPDRNFRGNQQVRRNWTAIFGSVPNFRLDVLRSAVSGDTAWLELQATGTRQSDNAPVRDVAVFILGVRDGKVAWARVYSDEVRRGDSIDASIQETYH
jgi:ketosteroid isomerase-like protein